MTDPSSLADRVAQLEARLDALARIVVTRRVVVVDGEGVERVVLSAAPGTGSVLVRLDRPEGRTTGVELVACEPSDEQPIVGLVELREGEVVELPPPSDAAPPP
ncbi:MAG: hypothetical protein R2701_02130 [Acidimicrobiales bacterium]|nr:hypothetical protein [Acidimicrobiales bacterium]